MPSNVAAHSMYNERLNECNYLLRSEPSGLEHGQPVSTDRLTDCDTDNFAQA